MCVVTRLEMLLKYYPSMAGILEDPESHCLLFSPIIRIILDWGGGLTSDFVIPGVCNTT